MPERIPSSTGINFRAAFPPFTGIFIFPARPPGRDQFYHTEDERFTLGVQGGGWGRIHDAEVMLV